MTRMSHRWLGYSQVVLGLLLILVFVPVLVELSSNDREREAYYAKEAAALPLPDLLNEMRQIEKELAAPVGRGEDYFPIADHVLHIDHLLKYRMLNFPHEREVIAEQMQRAGVDYLYNLQDLQRRYFDIVGVAPFIASRDQYDRIHPGWGFESAEDKVESDVIFYLKNCWISSLLVALLFFLVRLRREGMRFLPEADRVLGAALIWPYAVFHYPHKVDLLAQMRRAKQRLAYFVATLLSLSPMGAFAKAIGERGSEDGEQGSSEKTLVVDMVPTPKFSLAGGVMYNKVVTNGTVLAEGPVVWSELTATFGRLSFDYWGSRDLGESGGSDENDYGGWWSGSLGPNTLTVGGYYADIRPLGSVSGGDVIYPFASLDLPIGGNFVANLRAEAYFLTKALPDVHGFAVTAGVKRSFSLGGGVSLEHGSTFAYGDGPFGQEPVINYRNDESVMVPLTDRLKAFFSVKAYIPLYGQGRKPTFTGGASLSFAVN